MFAGKGWLQMRPPPGYKPGIGRGAIPLREAELENATSALGPGASGLPRTGKRNLPRDQEGQRFDDAPEVSQSTRPLRSHDDDLADKVYAAVDSRKRRSRMSAAPSAIALGMNRISAEFSDLRKELRGVSEAEWAALPEAPDLTRKGKRLREEERSSRRTYAPPDSLIASNASKADVTTNIGNIERTRHALESLVRADPTSATGWIGLVRVEEAAERPRHARSMAQRGTRSCPESPEMWLESIRVHMDMPAAARSVAAQAVAALPTNFELWLKAVNLETDLVSQRVVVHKALEALPLSAELWQRAAELEEDAQTRRAVLSTAIELVPVDSSAQLWRMLVAVEPSALPKALSILPQDVGLISEALIPYPSLAANAITGGGECGGVDRESWLQRLPSMSEQAQNALLTILKPTEADADIASALPHAEQRRIWQHMPRSEAVWLKLTSLADSRDERVEILVKATGACSHSRVLWKLLVAEHAGSLEDMLELSSDPDVWLVGLRFAAQSAKQLDLAKRAVTRFPGDAPLAAELAHLQRVVAHNIQGAAEILRKGLKLHPESALLATELVLSGLENDDTNSPHVRYSDLPPSPEKPQLWLALAATASSSVRRRALLDRATAEFPFESVLWRERIRLEVAGSPAAKVVISQARRACPTSGLIWFEELRATPRLSRRKRLAEAVRETDGDAWVLLFAGLEFAATGRHAKAVEWIERAVKADPQNGDAWAWLAHFSLPESNINERLVAMHPRGGVVWPLERIPPLDRLKTFPFATLESEIAS